MIAILCVGNVKEHEIHLTLHCCSHKSPMREAGAAG